MKMVKRKDSESESEGAAGAAAAAEPRFRISVCMQRFHRDERARAWLLVSARRRVRWLQRRLRRLFALPARLRLLCRGHLLPRGEPLALLERDDLVEVVPVLAESDETSAAPDEVDSVAAGPLDECVAPEPERTLSTSPAPSLSPSPALIPSDDLMQSKQRALLMLEELSATDNMLPQRPRRRRVRRRRRAAPSQPEDGQVLSAPPASARESTQPAGGSRVLSAPTTSAHESTQPADGSRVLSAPPTAGAVGAAAPAGVLRNGLAPRAPRVVRPLCSVTGAPPLGPLPCDTPGAPPLGLLPCDTLEAPPLVPPPCNKPGALPYEMPGDPSPAPQHPTCEIIHLSLQ